ncbi:unnamed protein product [Urochloa humidicola]
MSQEGAADSPHEVEYSHDHATGPDDGDGSTPAIVGPAIVTPANSNSNSGGELASETNYAGSSMPLPASPEVLHAGEDNNAGSKLASPELASTTVLHAGEDNDAARSKLSSPVVLHAGEDNGDPAEHNKLAIQAAMPHAGEDTNAGFKLDGPPAVLDAELAIISQAVPRAGEEDKDNNAGPNLDSSEPAVIHAAGEDDNKAGSKLSIQAIPHAGEDDSAESSKLATAAALPADEGNNAGGDNNAGSKLSIPASGVDAAAGGNNAKDGLKNGVAGEEEGGANGVVAAANTNSGGGAPSNPVKDDAPAAVANRGRGRGRGRVRGKGKSVATEEEKAIHIWTEKERRKKMKTMFGALHALLPQLPEKADKSTIVGEAVTYIKTLEGTVRNLETLKQERIRAHQVAAGAGCSRAPPAFPAPPAQAAPTREAILADMVQSWNAQEDLMAELRAAASAVVAASAGSSTSAAAAAAAAAPRTAAAAPSPAPAPALQTWSGPNIVVCVAGHDAFINICTPRRPGMLTRLLAVLEKHRVGVVTTTVSSDHIHTFFSIQARINAATPPPPMLPENVTVLDRYKLVVSEMLHAVAN